MNGHFGIPNECLAVPTHVAPDSLFEKPLIARKCCFVHCGRSDCECERWIRRDAAEQYRQFMHMLDKIPDPELCRPKPRIRVKAGSRKLPTGAGL